MNAMGAVKYSSEYSTQTVCSQTAKSLMEMVARDGIEPSTRGFSDRLPQKRPLQDS